MMRADEGEIGPVQAIEIAEQWAREASRSGAPWTVVDLGEAGFMAMPCAKGDVAAGRHVATYRNGEKATDG